MSYIGNQPTSVAFPTDTFSGNGSTTVFTMTVAPANTASVLIFISGVKQDPSTYSVVGTTLTFSAAPPSGTSNISCIYLGVPASGVTTTAYRAVNSYTATAGQTTFTPPSYTPNFINVYRNGVLLTPTSDYTATNGTTVVLATGATAGDTVLVESFLVSSVLNALPLSGGTVTGNVNIIGDETVTGKVQIQQDSGSNNRLIFRGQPGSSYRYNIDNYGSSNNLRVFRENDGDASGGVVLLNLNSNGNLALQGGSSSATGVGITFPGTQSASTDANCLDDYEEGTWTPAFDFTSGNGTLVPDTFRYGRYTKIGNQVNCTFYLSMATKGTASGDCRITLPFTSNSTSANYSCSAVWVGSATGTSGGFQGYTAPGEAIVRFQYTATGAQANVTSSNCQNGTSFMVNLTYTV